MASERGVPAFPEGYENPSTVDCFACGARGAFKGRLSRKDGRYGVISCPSCGLGMTWPFPGERELLEAYSTTYRNPDSTRFYSFVERVEKFLKERRSGKLGRPVKGGRVLDVGCGRGGFVKDVSRLGWQATGIEIDPRVEARGREEGLDLRYGVLEDMAFPSGHFDAITFFHVFEHLRDPERTLGECRRILKKGGLLLIAVPNSDSLQARISGRLWFHADPPYHLYHYSHGNLDKFLKKKGFRVERVREFSLEYGPFGFLQSLYNLAGFRRNGLYDFLRAGKVRGAFGLAGVFLLLPVLAPIAFVLSIIEAAFGHGGCIEVYARKAD